MPSLGLGQRLRRAPPDGRVPRSAPRTFLKELRWNQAYCRLAAGF